MTLKNVSESSAPRSDFDDRPMTEWKSRPEVLPEPEPDLPGLEAERLDSALVSPMEPPQRHRSGFWRSGKGIAVGLGVAVAIASVAYWNHTQSEQPVAAEPQKSEAPAGQSVQVETAESTLVSQSFPAQGTVEARNWVSVIPKSPGVQIKEIRVQEGQWVEKGQVIAVLDNSLQGDRLDQAIAQVASAKAQLQATQTQIATSEAQLQSAQAQLRSARAGVEQRGAQYAQQKAVLAEAESNLNRYEDLAKEGGISRQELESRRTSAKTSKEGLHVSQMDISSAEAVVGQAQAEVSKAQAGINQAQAAIRQQQAQVNNAIARVQELTTQQEQATFVKAPAAGIVARKTVNVGDLTGTTALFMIEEKGALELQAQVPDVLLPQVRIGATAQISSEADNRIQLVGKVREINPVVDAKSRQATVKIDLPSSRWLKPGMFLKVAIATQTAAAVTVPAASVLAQADGQKIVYVLANNIAKARVVQVGEPHAGRLMVQSGLSPGEQVVTMGAGFLKDGDRVHVVP